MYRRFLRPGWIAGHLLVVLAALVCLRLGWWQWDRSHESTGTAQNLGYALLWPCFAGAFLYMWFRFLRLEVVKDEDERDAPREHEALEPGPEPAAADPAVPAGDVPEVAEPADEREPGVGRFRPADMETVAVATVDNDEDDPELAAYNRALAELAERDRRAR
ncbi:hypothetical protein GIS00_20955 [Nakamurella sp. YIM 132087]|uniref:Uncharacterized protein n=1 Tax=Nakamurella alba TaxID=2665158 RepID=A0A7K1FSN5_9ACTN|nr:hypothetical protein [Nakamurella alba]MTD16409.1 hypothetical protein [Nakamurella alba]